MSGFRPALAVYVLWHPAFQAGSALARELFTQLYGNLAEPESRGIGIPVFFRSKPPPGQALPPGIDLEAAEETVAVLLVDGTLARNAAWLQYADTLRQQLHPGRLLPVHLSPRVSRLPPGLRTLNAIRLAEVDPRLRPSRLVHHVTHELCRTLLHHPRGRTGPGDASLSPAPVRLFISHAKRDGEALALQLKQYIDQQTPAESFFDAKDIAPGHEFPLEIFKSVAHSALVVLQTDAYASREWCRREVIEAKRLGRPILVVDALEHGEERSFPYLGNVPTLRWNRKHRPARAMRERIVDAALHEVLRCTFFVRHFEQFCQAYGPLASAQVLPRPPELPFHSLAGGASTVVVYPDPQLGSEELDILQEFSPALRSLTPLGLTRVLVGAERVGPLLADWRLALSIGNPGEEELLRHGLAEEHLQAAMQEIARHLLAHGARLAYGGDARKEGFTEKLLTLVRRHRLAGRGEFHRLENYLAWPRYLHVGHDEQREEDLVTLEVKLPEDVSGAEPPASGELTTEQRYVNARALTAMRERMAQEAQGRLVLGGKLAGYSGRMPGILEEGVLMLQAGKPLFIMGGFGGAAAAMVQILEGGAGEALGSAYQMKDPRLVGLDAQYRKHGRGGLGLDEAVATLRRTPLEGLNNGLEESENHRLFHSRCLEEIISLVMMGLARLAVRPRSQVHAGPTPAATSA